jgi:hypothetical protein
MVLFDTRRDAENALAHQFSAASEYIEEGFGCLDEAITKLHSIDSPFARVCSLTLVKVRNLSLAVLSLTMDGLAQEAGAIFRPLIGIIEKLAYFRLDPNHIEQAITDQLPPEGQIAKKINGSFQELRDYLSQYSSHSSFDYESMKHLLNVRKGQLIIRQPFIETAFKKNLEMVFSFLIIEAFEAYRCLEHAGHPDPKFLGRIQVLNKEGYFATRLP